MWFAYLLLLWLVFYLLNLLPPPGRLYVDLYSLILIFLSYQGRILSATFLALLAGLLLDAYGSGPLGLETSRLLLAVHGIRLLQLWLNLRYPLPQILAVALLVLGQWLLTVGWLNLLLPSGLTTPPWTVTLTAAGVTGLVAPFLFVLLTHLDQQLRRLFLPGGFSRD